MSENMDHKQPTALAGTEKLLQLAERFRSSNHPDEIKRLGDELGRLVFGK